MAREITNATTNSRVQYAEKERISADDDGAISERIRLRAHAIWESEGGPYDRQMEHWSQAEREVRDQVDTREEGEVPNLAALREAAREHTDTYMVATDLIDADQREATPGMREQP